MRATGFLILSAAMAVAAPVEAWLGASVGFEPNTGQAAAEVRYLARTRNFVLYLTDRGTVLAGRNRSQLRTTFGGALPAPIRGEKRQESVTNYFVGNDPLKWRVGVPNFEQARYAGVYPGIDLVYYGNEGRVEYDWIVAPGADASKIRMDFENAEQIRVDRHGDLVIRMGDGEFRHKRPRMYQDIGGKRVTVAGGWTLHGNEGRFQVGTYDRTKPLVIDPPLAYSTYAGGSGLDWAYAIAVDSIGNTYVTGISGSANFPGAAGLKGTEDVFVMKINPGGTSKLYTTILGGGGADEGHGIAVDAQGNAYITGSTGSLDFPTKNPVQAAFGGSGDAFVAKLSANGAALLYATYLGGNGSDIGNGIAVDSSGNVYVVGTTFSTNFPVQAAFQASKGAQQDAFLTKISTSGNSLAYSTYLGGNSADEGNGIAVDAAGNAYVTGYTASTNFPVQSAFRGSNAGSVDAFVTKMNPAGSALVYSTYLGGSATDYGTAIAVDPAGYAYVTGIVTSDDFPLVNPIDPKLATHAVDDAFIAKLNPSGSALVYSTYFGGGSADDPYAIALDQSGNVYITGRTNSSDFPLASPIQTTRFAFDLFVTEINAAGSAALFSTFLGGTGSESGRGIAVDNLGNIHIAGEGTSTDFPTVKALQAANGGGAGSQDGLVLMLGTAPPVNGPTITTVSDNLIDGGPLEPGGWFYVKGSNLADVQRIWGGSDFSDPNTLPTNLNGVEVWVNGAPVPVYFISPGQVNAQAPSNISGSVSVQVFRLGLGSNILTAPVTQFQPSIYNYQVGGKSYAAALFSDYALMGDPAVTPGTRKAKPGDIVQLYCAGLGPAPSGGTIGSPMPVSGVGITIGTTAATVSFAGLVAPGQYQVNFTVPQIADGEYPIVVSVSGKSSPPNILFEIAQ